ncbi:phage-related protein [Mycobacterium sp. MAA66]|uniref:phage tail tape measure protein n=1 Tax=Mycobacterium sp. MAA66 TaxID=3156297 RepID=UPI0035132B2A
MALANSGKALASGWIELSVKYGSAMSQIGKDFDQLQDKAGEAGKKAGEAAGSQLHSGIVSHIERAARDAGTKLEIGITAGMKQAGVKSAFELDSAGVDMARRADRLGAKVGFAMARSITAPLGGLAAFGRRAGEQLTTGFKETGERLHEHLGKSLDKVKERAVDTMGEITPGLGGLAGGLAAIGPEGMAAGAGIAAVAAPFAVLLDVGHKWEGLQSKLQFSTAMSSDQIQKNLSMIGQIGKDIPVSFEQIGDVFGDVTKNLHLTGDALKTVASQVSVFQHRTGEAVDIEGLGGLKRVLKMGDNEVPQLLDQLYTANTKSGVDINKMIDVLGRSGPLLKQFGIDAGQSASLLTQFDEAGIDVNKVMPTMAHAFTVSAKAGQPFNKFVNDQIENIKKLVASGDEVDAAKVANKVFGTGLRGGGASVITAIQNGAELNAGAGDDGPRKSILDEGRKSETLDDKWQRIKNQAEEALRPIASPLMDGIVSGFEALSKSMPGMISTLKTAFGYVEPAVKGAFNILKPVFEAGVSVVKLVWDGLKGFWHALQDIWHGDFKQLWSDVKNAASKMWDDVKDAGVHLWEGIKTTALDVWHGVANTAGKVWDAAKVAAVNVWNDIKNVAIGLWNDVKSAFEAAWNGVKSVFNSLGDAITGVVNFFADLPGKILNGIGDLGSSIADKVSGFFSNPFASHRAMGGPLGFAGGGSLDAAPGPIGRDSALFWGARGEHVLTSGDVKQMGGHAGVFAFRKALHREDGGPVGPDVQAAMSMDGTGYSQGSRNDCSGMVGRVITSAMGQPITSLPSTQNMRQWLAARGFKDGIGGPGSISVGWYNHGSAPNDGHAAMTLSNGMNAESGGSHGNFLVGAGAAGASNPQFTDHMYLPMSALYGEGSPWGGVSSAFEGSGGGGVGGGSRGGIPAGATPAVGPHGELGYMTAPNPEKVSKAQDRVDKLNDEISKLEDKKEHLGPKVKQAERDKLDHEISVKKADLKEAQDKLGEAQQGEFHKAKSEGEKKEKSPFDFAALGDIGSKGIAESVLPDGFMNPFDTTAAHVGSGLLGFFSGLDPDPVSRGILGVGAGALSGKGSAVATALKDLLSPKALEGDARLAGGRGSMGDPAGADGGTVINNNKFGPDYSGATIGHDPAEHQQAVQNDSNAVQRSTAFSTQRIGVSASS